MKDSERTVLIVAGAAILALYAGAKMAKAVSDAVNSGVTTAEALVAAPGEFVSGVSDGILGILAFPGLFGFSVGQSIGEGAGSAEDAAGGALDNQSEQAGNNINQY